MIVVTACRLAGPGALLVARPNGVPHVYVGPTTPSGRFVPTASRPICRAHTRRLGVIPRGALPADVRVCARCSTQLAKAPRPVTRDEWLARFGHVTLDDLQAEARAATTDAWLDSVAYLSLLVHGHKACAAPLPNQPTRSFHELIGSRRRVLNPTRDRTSERLAALGETARNARAGERALIREQIEARVDRLGINLAKPAKKK